MKFKLVHPCVYVFTCLRVYVNTTKAAFALSVVFSLSSMVSYFSLLNSYETKANILAVDNFSSFYSASNNSVLKFSNEGKFLYRYEEFNYGKIGMIDVSNPMKMMVFYPDFMTVVTLDKFLSPLTTYNFFNSAIRIFLQWLLLLTDEFGFTTTPILN